MPYTVYAEGVSHGVRLIPERREYEISLDCRHPIVLYFTFRTFRKAYVCIAPEIFGMNIYRFDCASRELAVVSQLRGRAYDRFKRSLAWLRRQTQNRVHKFDIRFYWQLAFLAKKGLNSNLNLKMLAENYDGEATQ